MLKLWFHMPALNITWVGFGSSLAIYSLTHTSQSSYCQILVVGMSSIFVGRSSKWNDEIFSMALVAGTRPCIGLMWPYACRYTSMLSLSSSIKYRLLTYLARCCRVFLIIFGGRSQSHRSWGLNSWLVYLLRSFQEIFVNPWWLKMSGPSVEELYQVDVLRKYASDKYW